jgi:hypothetical protein
MARHSGRPFVYIGLSRDRLYIIIEPVATFAKGDVGVGLMIGIARALSTITLQPVG